MTHKTVLQRLDDAANLTGIPNLATHQARRRSMRWLPMIPLAMALGGCIVCFAGPDRHAIGQIVATVAFAISVWLPLAGPLKPLGAIEGVDEREREQRSRAFLVTLSIVAVVATAALFLLPVLAIIGQWPPEMLSRRSMTLGFALFATFNALPTLYASWATAPLPEEEG